MKKLCITLLTVLTFTTLSMAQVSIRGGVNMASMSASATESSYQDYKQQSILGYQAALVMPIKLTDNVAIQPELMWIQKGGKFDYTINSNNKLVVSRTYNYFEVPLSLKLSLGNTSGGLGIYVLGGPYAGLALNGKTKRETTIGGVTSVAESTVDYSSDSNQEKRLDWGANIGAGVTFGKIYIDARYNLGINNLLDDDASNTNDNKPYQRNRGLGLTVGLMF